MTICSIYPTHSPFKSIPERISFQTGPGSRIVFDGGSEGFLLALKALQERSMNQSIVADGLCLFDKGSLETFVLTENTPPIQIDYGDSSTKTFKAALGETIVIYWLSRPDSSIKRPFENACRQLRYTPYFLESIPQKVEFAE